MSTRPDALFNLADAMAEDILNTPDDEVLREVEEDFGDPRALANKFDQILERAEKQVFGTARSAASPQVRSSVLDLPISLPHETIRWVKGIFDLGSRISEFLSSLTPRTLAWSAIAAVVAILIPAAVITAVVIKEQGAPSSQTLATSGIPDVPPLASFGERADQLPMQTQMTNTPPTQMTVDPTAVSSSASIPAVRLSDEETAALVARGRELIVAENIATARLVLQRAAEAGNAIAALELGATYDPFILRETQDKLPRPGGAVFAEPTVSTPTVADVAMAKAWYKKARDLGSAEAAVRLERLRSAPAR
jgi:hypothetical protein